MKSLDVPEVTQGRPHGMVCAMRTLLFSVLLALPVMVGTPVLAQALEIAVPAAGTLMRDAGPPLFQRVNIIDGKDDRDSLLTIGPSLGLSRGEIGRIRQVSGYVGCLSPSPSVGSAALFLTNQQILTAAHVFFEPSGKRRWKCFFRPQSPGGPMIDLVVDDNTQFGSKKPKAGSNNDWAIVRLVEPLAGAVPFPVKPDVPVQNGDKLIVITAHPADMEKEVDRDVPVAQGCRVRRAIDKSRSAAATSFFRTDCDATGASSGGMHLSRVNGELAFRGITITTGPWRDPRYKGAPYDEKAGSVTTALGTDAAILSAGRAVAAGGF
ncbi:serine protease [Kaistia sp. 32K]|uniref:trypsin-like serine peptidase n=1 Tax=Kaistia sp. 32K TaxID=2795690 RepID=UPI0019162237|nr:serine protease [Kaistia sp. 32K]